MHAVQNKRQNSAQKSKTTWLIIASFDLFVYFLKKYIKLYFHLIFSFSSLQPSVYNPTGKKKD